MMSDRPKVTVFKDRCDVTFQNVEQYIKVNIMLLKADIMLLKGSGKISRSHHALDRSKTLLNRGGRKASVYG